MDPQKKLTNLPWASILAKRGETRKTKKIADGTPSDALKREDPTGYERIYSGGARDQENPRKKKKM